MSMEFTVYIAQPASEHAPWRVTCAGRPVEELRDFRQAVGRAVEYARLMEAAGYIVVVKLEDPDGTWRIYRA